MAALQRGKVYDMRYEQYHEDPYPRLFVIESNTEDTFGLNIHYLKKFPSPRNTYRPLDYNLYLKLQEVWMTGIHRRFFEFIVDEDPTLMPPRGIMTVLRAKFPYVIDICYRRYKTRHISATDPIVIEGSHKLDEFTG